MAPRNRVLSRLLAREQRAFLGRDRGAWGEHLARARDFLGEALQGPGPVLVLGAGAGLELPWALAPANCTGWDADPWSRAWTFLRHRRWPPWIFSDVTGGLAELDGLAARCLQQPWGGGQARPRDRALARLGALLEGLSPRPVELEAWLAAHRPARVLSANLLGQLGVVAQRMLERRLGPWPWIRFPTGEDPVSEALEGWIPRAVVAQLRVLADSGAALWLVYDRAVIHGAGALSLGPFQEDWRAQLQGEGTVELEDPLAGLDVAAWLRRKAPDRRILRQERWLWPLAPGQCHLVEAIAVAAQGTEAGPGFA